MTILAASAQFSFVNIGMAVRANGSNLVKHQAAMTICTGSLFMRTRQNKTGLIMIKTCPINFMPIGGRVTGHATKSHFFSMRAQDGRLSLN